MKKIPERLFYCRGCGYSLKDSIPIKKDSKDRVFLLDEFNMQNKAQEKT